MRNFYKLIVVTVLLITSFSAFAYYPIPLGKWRCAAIDATKHSYITIANTLPQGMDRALKMCRRMSHYSRSCSIVESNCTQGGVTPYRSS